MAGYMTWLTGQGLERSIERAWWKMGESVSDALMDRTSTYATTITIDVENASLTFSAVKQ